VAVYLKPLLSNLGGFFEGEKGTVSANTHVITKYTILRTERLCSINKTVNIGTRSCNHCCRGRGVIIIAHSECVFVALIIQNAKRMCRIIFSSVACRALQYFSSLSYE
jgi:hypothetical protein